MYKSRQSVQKQRAVIEDLFTSELEEAEILKKHGVKPALYQKWLTDEQFLEHFERRLVQAHHASRVALARYASLAAGRLIELTMCDQKETARKACLDIIYPQNPDTVVRASARDPGEANEDVRATNLSPETAGRILAILAEKPSTEVSGQEGSTGLQAQA